MTAGWSVLFTAPCYYQPPAPSLHSCHPATSVAQGQGSHPAEKSQLWGCFYSPVVLLFPHGHRRAAADKRTAALSPGATQPPPGAAMGAEKPQGRMLSQMKQQGRSLLAGLVVGICRVPALCQPRQQPGAQSFLPSLLHQPVSVSKKINPGFSQLKKK